MRNKNKAWVAIWFGICVIIFFLGSIEKMTFYKSTVNGIRTEMYNIVMTSYKMIDESRSGKIIMSEDREIEIISIINGHNFKQLTEREYEAVSLIIKATTRQYFIDNNKGTKDEIDEYKNVVDDCMKRLKVLLKLKEATTGKCDTQMSLSFLRYSVG